MAAVKANRWADAQAEAARFADPTAEKLVLYLRLRVPGAATAEEIALFMQRNPDWPAQGMLERRRQEAVATDPDDAAVLAQCERTRRPWPPPCCAAPRQPPTPAAPPMPTRWRDGRGWTPSTMPLTEAAFLRRWGGLATPEDEWSRFQRLAWSNDQAAIRQITRLDTTQRKAAEARIAAKRDDPNTEALVAALPPPLQTDPGLLLDRARALRHADHLAEAAALLSRASVL